MSGADSKWEHAKAAARRQRNRGRDEITYEQVHPVSREEAEELISHAPGRGEIAAILLGLALHEPDRDWTEATLRRWSRDGDPQLRTAVTVSFGHIARRFGELDGASWARLAWLASDPATSGPAQDALEDARMFTSGDPGWDKPVLLIDGDRFDDFAGFAREFSNLLSDWTWNENLDAFNDILRGGFGTPEDGFVLRWINSDRSREVLGWVETISFIERKLERCHPANRGRVAEDLEAVHRSEGETLFDLLVSIIRAHGPGGAESDSMVDLELA